MKKIIIIIFLIFTVTLTSCQKTEDEFSYEVKLFHQYSEIYDDVIFREFIYLHGVNIIDTYEDYLGIVYVPNYIEHTLTYDENFFEEHTLILINVYHEKAENFNVDVIHTNGILDVYIQQMNGFYRFNAPALSYIWTIAIEVNIDTVYDVNYQIFESNDYYSFYTYWLSGSHSDLQGTYIFEDIYTWNAYINPILSINETNMNRNAFFKNHDIDSLQSIVESTTFDEKVVVVHFSGNNYGEMHYLPIDVYRLIDIGYDRNLMYFKLFRLNGYPDIGHETSGHSISIFFIDRKNGLFIPVIQFIDDHFS